MLFGLVSTSVAAVTLAGLRTFRVERGEFTSRFVYFLCRYCLPCWGFQEVMVRIVFGHFFPGKFETQFRNA